MKGKDGNEEMEEMKNKEPGRKEGRRRICKKREMEQGRKKERLKEIKKGGGGSQKMTAKMPSGIHKNT